MKLSPLSLFVRSAKMTIPCWKILLRVVAMYSRLSIPLIYHNSGFVIICLLHLVDHLVDLVDHLVHDVFQAGGKVAASVVLNHFLPMDTRDYFYYQVIVFFHA